MDFSSSKSILLFRVGLLAATIFLLAYQIYADGFIVSQLVLLILSGLQIRALVTLMDKGNKEIISFLNSIRNDDLSYSYSTNAKNEDVNKLNAELNRVLKDLQEVRKEKEADFQYLNNIVQHIGIGLITFDKQGNVQIINTSAKRLLKVTNIENITDLKSISENLVETFLRLRTGGRDLLRLEIGDDIVQLAVYAIELTLRGDVYKLISIQNIQNELEEKEMEAWQNLVRVLTHEIMNSVTPISSLANTVEEELNLQLVNDHEVNSISNDEIEDILYGLYR